MSLVRLLTSGKALTTLRDLPSAYRLRRDGWLPKFGLGRDPFAAKEPTVPVEVPVAPSIAVANGAIARRSIWPWSVREAGANGKAGAGLGSKAMSHAAKDAPMPVQVELSLESVKVVRNDLHGSDVDLVRSGNIAEKPYQQVASNLISGANAAEQALDRLAARIVGVEAR